MTDRQILLVKHSWSFVIIRSEEAGELFYNKLFELHPELRPMFKNDLVFQAKKLIAMVTVMITKLQKMDDIMPEIHALAQRHVGYGTRPEHYAVVGKALVWMLEQGLGNRWTDETRVAWETWYNQLAKAMIEATEQPGSYISPFKPVESSNASE
ncbi:hemin receptor [Rhodocytophaga rosea]|uniref:Hemin receptor n=1 Tax=Rhodocytophaga rosea TaxID=2704465 RepID=A0A6C0GI60_9BACT|nr:globin family protein [Rhodocytophaga rosea]QHT67514.1 hemin receptor [Rhodocytophaga rosea]